MKKIIVLLMLSSSVIAGERKFNALDQSDANYRQYQANLCAGYRENYERNTKDRAALDQSLKGNFKTEEARQAVISDWVITTELRDITLYLIKQNCQ